jgi:hypothetical protein
VCRESLYRENRACQDRRELRAQADRLELLVNREKQALKVFQVKASPDQQENKDPLVTLDLQDPAGPGVCLSAVRWDLQEHKVCKATLVR